MSEDDESEVSDVQGFDPPAYLTRRARKIWRALMADLGDEKKESDRSLYADYARISAQVEKLSDDVEREGYIVAANDSVKANPKAQLLSVASGQLAALRRDLNMTPRARSEKGQKKAAAPFGGM